jgi:Secretion system C-terminal sorting domain
LYPNPVKDELNIEGLNLGETTISILDVQGRELKTITNGKSNSINVKQLSAGVYYLKIESDKKITVLKFVKE